MTLIDKFYKYENLRKNNLCGSCYKQEKKIFDKLKFNFISGIQLPPWIAEASESLEFIVIW